MFFSGPDFYKWNNNIKMIDCNPRIGQGLQQIDDVHKNTIVPKILQNKTFSYDKQIYWVLSNLKPGKIERVSDISHIKYRSKTNWDLKPGMIIPEFQHLVMGGFRQAFVIEGTNESDMQKTYQNAEGYWGDAELYLTHRVST